jgi:hypothetical protein
MVTALTQARLPALQRDWWLARASTKSSAEVALVFVMTALLSDTTNPTPKEKDVKRDFQPSFGDPDPTSPRGTCKREIITDVPPTTEPSPSELVCQLSPLVSSEAWIALTCEASRVISAC